LANDVEFTDHFFPMLGCILSIRDDRVQRFYQVKRYGFFHTSDEILMIDVNAGSVEEADRLASEQGEIIKGEHLYERLRELEQQMINLAEKQNHLLENNET